MSEYIEFAVRVPKDEADYFIARFGKGNVRILGFLLGEEIVRCRDCDLSHEDELGNLRCHGPLTEPWDYYNDEPSDGVEVEPSGFCAWARPKEDE